MKYKNYYLSFPPNNPKLLIPNLSLSAQSDSFMLYAPGSKAGKILKKIGMAAARIGIFKIIGCFGSVLPDSLIIPQTIKPIICNEILELLRQDWEAALNVKQINFAISLGTPDFFQKITALIFDQDNKILSIAKIGCTPQARKLILHEYSTLKHIQAISLQKCIVPLAIGCGTSGPATWMLQTVITGGTSSPDILKNGHLSFLSELAKITQVTAPLSSISFWEQIKKSISTTYPNKNTTLLKEKQFFTTLINKADETIVSAENMSWPLVSAHGDFTPWNIRMIDGKKIAIYDWEYFINTAPAGWDIIRFIFMAEHLLKRKNMADVFSNFISGNLHNNTIDQWEKMSGIYIPDRQLLATLFLLDLYVEASRNIIINNVSRKT